ncbi:polysaccharide pyruvyl transferase family protein [Flavobacterium sp. SH_e]|uniref:polysaccharide pyruvyl transferase family protein n=1 Tax=Flavobacterium TaxID=237 RepID=UPI0021E4C6B6|nr:polysaccharide pyruvyl transferase family protein [Flavobacterium sp. SH_e]MCV2483982.1 polysaccharide pyruvyl transferase family protein [Flavobacterium sp. SH_e]
MMNKLIFLKAYLRGFIVSKFKVQNNNAETNRYKDYGILNPSIGTANLGDLIIYDSVYSKLRDIYPDDLFTDFPTQLYTSHDAMISMNERHLLFVSGTNLLSSNLDRIFQWKIHFGHKRLLKNKVVLMGCGWWQYQGGINKYTAAIYKTILSKDVLHSVRDEYTANKLKSIGINNVINTSCPTLWSLSPEKCKQIPISKASEVVTTLTFYHKNSELDKTMLRILSENYNKVYLWIQGMNDFHYYNEINENFHNIELISPSIEAYNNLLEKGNIDYIGTRLHAGVRALQKNIRTLILAVDNRAIEISKDVNLNVIKREDVLDMVNFIDNDYVTNIKLPTGNIDKWISSLNKYK